eukprot:Gb_14396 [translate_table: standard]
MKATGSIKESENTLKEGGVDGDLVSLQDQGLCKDLFHKYLQEVLVASRRYKLELLAACLHLCLSAPPPLIDIGSLVGPVTNALKIGLRYPQLFFCNTYFLVGLFEKCMSVSYLEFLEGSEQ